MELKFCKDCRHFQPAQANLGTQVPPQCTHGENIDTDLVMGTKRRTRSPQQMRDHGGPCGRQAALFEVKTP